jgi:hypothetical protein
MRFSRRWGWIDLKCHGVFIQESDWRHTKMNDSFMFANRLQQFRPCKAFEVTFIRYEPASDSL